MAVATCIAGRGMAMATMQTRRISCLARQPVARMPRTPRPGMAMPSRQAGAKVSTGIPYTSQLANRRSKRMTVHAWGRPHTPDAAATAAVAAAAHSAKVLATPLWQHALRSMATVGLSLVLAVWASQVLHKEADKADAGEELTWMQSMDDAEKQASRPWLQHVWEATLLALQRPAAVCLPVLAAVVSMRSAGGFLDALLTYHRQQPFLSQWLATLAARSVSMLTAAQIVAHEAAQVAVIAFIVWGMLRFKERMVKVLMDIQIAKDVKRGVNTQNAENSMERVVLPFSGLASWLLILGGGLATLSVLGINIQPLLTVGGVSGIIVGLSAQSVMSNMISGINLFISRPFVVGERIEIMAPGSGSKWLVGVVERVDPMRTIIRSDSCLPITIPNKVLSEQVIHNESRIAKTRVLVNFNKPRVMSFTWGVRYQDFDQVQSIVKVMRAHLDRVEGIDRRLPLWVGFTGVDNNCCNIFTILHTTPAKSREYGGFREGLFYAFEKIIHQHGAQLALPTQVNLVPALEGAGKPSFSMGAPPGNGRPGNGHPNGQPQPALGL